MERRVVTQEEVDIWEMLQNERAAKTKLESTTTELPKQVSKQRLERDDYIGRILKYIPAEIIAVFVSAEATISSLQSDPTIFIPLKWVIFFVLLCLTPTYLWRVSIVKDISVIGNQQSESLGKDVVATTKIEKLKKELKDVRKKSTINHIVISTVAFVLWVFTLGGPFALYMSENGFCTENCWYHKEYGALVLPFFTLLIPLFRE